MEIDRVAPLGGVRQEADPAWARERMRRKKFTEDVPEPEKEPDQEAGEAEESRGGLDVMA